MHTFVAASIPILSRWCSLLMLRQSRLRNWSGHVPFVEDVPARGALPEVVRMTPMSPNAADLKAAIDNSLSELAQAVDEQNACAAMRRYLDLMARFHKYSWGNCWLIARARPTT